VLVVTKAKPQKPRVSVLFVNTGTWLSVKFLVFAVLQCQLIINTSVKLCLLHCLKRQSREHR